MNLSLRFQFIIGLAFFLVMTLFAQNSIQAKVSGASFGDPVLVDYPSVENPFTDVLAGSLLERATFELRRRGVVNGCSENTFCGERTINRAEALKLLFLARYDEVAEIHGGKYPDVEPGSWYERYVLRASELGIVNGYANGNFGPGDAVTTAQFAKMMGNIFGLPKNTAFSFSDVASTDWFAPYVGAVQQYDLFPGRTKNFLPNQALTRAEVAIAIYQYLAAKFPAAEIDIPEAPVSDAELIVQPTKISAITHNANYGQTVLWRGKIYASALHSVELQKITFQNTGTALAADVKHFTLSVETDTKNFQTQGGTVSGANADFELTFSNVAPTQSFAIAPDKPLDIILWAEVNGDLSGVAPTLQMALEVNNLHFAENGNVISVGSKNAAPLLSRTVTLSEVRLPREGGAPVLLSTYSQTPDSQILIAGSTQNIVSGLEFLSNLQPAYIQKLTLDITNVNTAGILGTDVADDIDAIAALELLYADGTPVLTKSGDAAHTEAISAGKAVFDNLDLVAEEDTDLNIFVTADLNEIRSNSPARSGMTFLVKPSATASEHTVRGLTNGAEMSLTDIGGNNPHNTGNPMYVMTDNLLVDTVTTTDILASGTQRDLLRFQFTRSSNADAFLRQVGAQINTTGSVTLRNVGLYNEKNQLVAFSKIPSSGNTYTLTVGVEDVDGDGNTDAGSAGTNGLTFDMSDLHELPNGSGELYDQIGNSGIYTLRADLNVGGANAQVVTSILMNGSTPGTSADQIIWRDEGTDSGEDGFTIPWISLPENDASTRLENVLHN